VQRPEIRDEAVGRWPGILTQLGVDAGAITGKHCACPMCGGKDRFRFDDKQGRGTWYCTHCGAGDGVKLVMARDGLDFRAAVARIRQALPQAAEVKIARERSVEQKRASLLRLWERAKRVETGDPVHQYLTARGIAAAPAGVRFVPQQPYYREGVKVGAYDAMVAVIRGPDGKGRSLHVTYLKDGKKADIDPSRKVMEAVTPLPGAAIRLAEAAETLGIAEGIETALSAMQMFDIPTWAATNTSLMEAFQWPATVRRLVIFGDNDPKFAGQKAAHVLAYRAATKDISVDIRIPSTPGFDWNDVHRQERGKA